MSLDQLRNLFAKPHPATDAPIAQGAGVPVHVVGDGPDWPRILAAAGFTLAEAWARHIAGPALRRGIHGGKRAAAFAATIAHESTGGQRLVESLNYTPEALSRTWPFRFPPADAERMGRTALHPADQRAIAERAYGGRMGNGPEGSGDGWRYRGRGLIQITGRDGYRLAGRAIGRDLESNPEIAEEWGVAAEVAAWTWATWKGCNPLADAGKVEAWREAINGGLNGLADVRARYQKALAVG